MVELRLKTNKGTLHLKANLETREIVRVEEGKEIPLEKEEIFLIKGALLTLDFYAERVL